MDFRLKFMFLLIISEKTKTKSKYHKSLKVTPYKLVQQTYQMAQSHFHPIKSNLKIILDKGF